MLKNMNVNFDNRPPRATFDDTAEREWQSVLLSEKYRIILAFTQPAKGYETVR